MRGVWLLASAHVGTGRRLRLSAGSARAVRVIEAERTGLAVRADPVAGYTESAVAVVVFLAVGTRLAAAAANPADANVGIAVFVLVAAVALTPVIAPAQSAVTSRQSSLLSQAVALAVSAGKTVGTRRTTKPWPVAPNVPPSTCSYLGDARGCRIRPRPGTNPR
jgi:hypothetical protein